MMRFLLPKGVTRAGCPDSTEAFTPPSRPRAPGAHLLPDHALAHIRDHGHGHPGALPVDEENAAQVHDKAHGPQEEQLALGNLHAAIREDLHEA